MATVQRGGRKRDASRGRYPGGQPTPVSDDFGPVEQRLKREVATGLRTLPNANAISDLMARLSAAGITQAAIARASVQRAAVKTSILTEDELKLVLAFINGVPPRMGLSAIDVLLARQIIDRDQFDAARDFTSCWCAYIGRPWPKGWSAERGSPDFNGGMSEAGLRRMKVHYWNCLSAMDLVDKMIYPLVSDVVIHGKMTGLVEEVISSDAVRIDGELIVRNGNRLPPSLRVRISRLTCGLDIIAKMQAKDYTREAEAVLNALATRARDESLTSS